MNRVVLITGGTGGIGLAAAEKFLREGDTVVVAGMDPQEKVESALASVAPYSMKHYRLNVCDKHGCADVVSSVIAEYGRLDVYVHVAGIRGGADRALDSDFDDVRNTIEINLMGTIVGSVSAAREMVKQGSGVIINISSISSLYVTAPDFGYHCSKAAVNMATKILAEQVAPCGVRCFAVAPGGVRTGMHSDDWYQKVINHSRSGRLIEREEIANIIYLLSLEDASPINGSVVLVSAGAGCDKGVWD